MEKLGTSISKQEILKLNEKYRSLSVDDRIIELYKDFEEETTMLTSSFAATSAYLLHLFAKHHPNQLVYFIDTGYHFEETLLYKNYLTAIYGLNVQDVKAEEWKHEFTTKEQTWKTDPDLCCSVNKVEPLAALQDKYSVWISGLMKWQSDHRSSLDIFEERNGILKFYPLLDVTSEQREAYIKEHLLPFHPLQAKGYFSIGCKNCTVPGKEREGRWNNSPKTECGLHL
jgi:phosphoadenosine phosphosulfate reductase